MGNNALSALEALTENSESVAFAYDITNERFTYLNPAFEQVWRKSRKSIQNNPFALLKTIHPEDKTHVEQAFRELLTGNLLQNTEFRILLRNYIERWVCVKPCLVEEKSVIVGYVDDITPSKHHTENLQKFSDKKNSILNILSYDLAGPLANIQALSRVLTSDLEEHENQEIHNIIAIIQKSSEQGMQLIQEFLKQEFLESSNVDLVMKRVELVEKLKTIVQEYQQNQHLMRLKFNFITSSEKIFLALDINKFLQALNNLISNAIKFTPDGGEITLSVEEKEKTVLLTLADTGIGIPEKFHVHLFDKFTNARRPGIKGESSVGLGMSIIKTIVEWHHGKIWLESQVNKGTIFFIELPKIEII